MDRISKLPPGIIETMLCLLPIQEAARTSILSREWRYHWTKIHKLVFIEHQFQVSTNRAELDFLEQRRGKLLYAIYQVLLIHEGPIHEFTLQMFVDRNSCVEIDHIMLHLLKKNSVKMLKLDFDNYYTLPLSLFSLHQLTKLYLCGCYLDHQPSSYEFGSLTSLYLDEVWTCHKTLLRLLSSCPLLKRLTIASDSINISESGATPIVDLFKCLPLIEYLSVWSGIVKCFVPKRLPKKLPTALVHLKYLCVNDVCFCHKYWLPFLVLLISSSPNLEKLELATMTVELEEDEMGSFKLEDYSNIMLEHLKEFVFWRFSNVENELDFMKIILAKSPVLKKVIIFPCCDESNEDEETEISKILSLSPFAAPAVEIIIRCRYF